MNLSASPNLMPVQIDETNVINMFAPTGVLNKGTFVCLVNTNSGNTNVYTSGNSPKTPYQAVTGALPANNPVPNYAYSPRAEVKWKIKQASVGDPCFGVLLYDCKDTNAFGEYFIYRPKHERHEQQVTLIGESAPVLTRGLVRVNGIHNPTTALAGSGAFVSGGKLFPQVFTKGDNSVGMFLSSTDAQGYALFWVSAV